MMLVVFFAFFKFTNNVLIIKSLSRILDSYNCLLILTNVYRTFDRALTVFDGISNNSDIFSFDMFHLMFFDN